MKLSTIALATALTFTLTSSFALAQTAPGLTGYGTVTAPSIGSYPTSVGTSQVIPTWSNTGPANQPTPRAFAPIRGGRAFK
jgi:hypothetical protein